MILDQLINFHMDFIIVYKKFFEIIKSTVKLPTIITILQSISLQISSP